MIPPLLLSGFIILELCMQRDQLILHNIMGNLKSTAYPGRLTLAGKHGQWLNMEGQGKEGTVGNTPSVSLMAVGTLYPNYKWENGEHRKRVK